MRVLALVVLVAAAGCGPSVRTLVKQGIEAELDELDIDAAADHYEAACLKGYGIACLLFENASFAIRPTPDEYARAEARYSAACEMGDGKACFRFGRVHDDERGLGLETTRAIRLYERACELGYDYACQRAAALYVVTWGWDLPVSDIRALCERSCDGGYGRSCVVLADLVKAGRGGPKSRPLSRELLRMACERGQAVACIRLATRTRYRATKRGIGKPEDAAADLEPLVGPAIEVCRLGHVAACLAAERLLTAKLPAPQSARLQALEAARAVAQKRAQRSARAHRQQRAVSQGESPAFYESYWVRRCFDEDAGMACFKVTGDRKAEAQKRGERLMKETVARWAQDWQRQCRDSVPFGCVKLLSAYEQGQLPAPGADEVGALDRRAKRLIQELRTRWKAQSDPSE